MTRIQTLSVLGLAHLSLSSLLLAQIPITSGNLVVLRIGDGVAALSSAAQPTFLDEFTPTGALVQSIPVPTAPNGLNLACTNNGTATSEGSLNLSPDGQWFTWGGYRAAPGTLAINGTASAANPRVVGRLSSATGLVDTSTSMNNAFSAGNIRSVATDNGVQFWCVGSNSGVQLATYATGTASVLTTSAPTNIRTIGIANGNLYCTSASSVYQGVSQIGSGLPTQATSITLLAGFPSAVGPSNYDFFFADPNTVYVADDRATTAGGGIQKWTQTGGTWTLAYTLAPTASSCRYLTGSVTNGVTTLYATSTTASANSLITVTDAGAGSPFVTLATALSNTVLRGVRLAGNRGAVSYTGTGSPTTAGIPSIGPIGNPVIGNTTFGIRGGNMQPFSISFLVIGLGNTLPFGIPVPGAPSTFFVYVNPVASTNLLLSDQTGAAVLPFSLPNNPSYVGVTLATQVVALDPALPNSLPLGSSVGMQIVIGQ
jgi:hypothetical protein